jgi:hypothetical protein
MESDKNNTTGEDCVEERDCIEESDCGPGETAVKDVSDTISCVYDCLIGTTEEEDKEAARESARRNAHALCAAAALLMAEEAKREREASFTEKIRRERRANRRWENLRHAVVKYADYIDDVKDDYFSDNIKGDIRDMLHDYKKIKMGKRANKAELEALLLLANKDDHLARLDLILEEFGERELQIRLRVKKLLRSLDYPKDRPRDDSDYSTSESEDDEWLQTDDDELEEAEAEAEAEEKPASE